MRKTRKENRSTEKVISYIVHLVSQENNNKIKLHPIYVWLLLLTNGFWSKAYFVLLKTHVYAYWLCVGVALTIFYGVARGKFNFVSFNRWGWSFNLFNWNITRIYSTYKRVRGVPFNTSYDTTIYRYHLKFSC